MSRPRPSRSVLVLPSPLVGSGAYAGLVDALAALGHPARVAPLPDGVASGAEVLAAFRRAVLAEVPDLVVAHSNAGLVAPAAADGIPVVFVDAALPASSGWSPMAPASLGEHLGTLAGPDGVLPAWTAWWSEEDLAPLFPDVATRRCVEAGEPRLPLAYFGTSVPVPPGWERGPHAYLAFGGTYAAELARARTLGWPHRVLDGTHHLHHLHDPGSVAVEVLALADLATGGGREDAGPHRGV